jgi:hypothetical protein
LLGISAEAARQRARPTAQAAIEATGTGAVGDLARRLRCDACGERGAWIVTAAAARPADYQDQQA